MSSTNNTPLTPIHCNTDAYLTNIMHAIAVVLHPAATLAAHDAAARIQDHQHYQTTIHTRLPAVFGVSLFLTMTSSRLVLRPAALRSAPGDRSGHATERPPRVAVQRQRRVSGSGGGLPRQLARLCQPGNRRRLRHPQPGGARRQGNGSGVTWFLCYNTASRLYATATS